MNVPFQSIQIEISGRCNARCPYCVTGQQNRLGRETGSFLAPEDFEEALQFLTSRGFIDKNTCVALFNYGEPLLHPQFGRIVEILEARGNPYELSTNASVRLGEALIRRMNGLRRMQFSMSGFSQASYDRVHGLDFPRVRDNVAAMARAIRAAHPDAECVMKLQVYAFNEGEVRDMLRFAAQLGMTVVPLHALYANLQQQMDFILRYRETQRLPETSDLLWYYLPELFRDGAAETQCEQHAELVIDENLDVAVCCMATKLMPEYKLCRLRDLTRELLDARPSSSLCRTCMAGGVSRSICRTPSYTKAVDFADVLRENARRAGRPVVLVGTGGLCASFRQMFPGLVSGSVAAPDETALARAHGARPAPYWVLADAQYARYRALLLENGWEETADFLCYFTYLR